MRFFLDANLPRAAIAVLVDSGHEAEFARDIGLAAAPVSGLRRTRDRRVPHF